MSINDSSKYQNDNYQESDVGSEYIFSSEEEFPKQKSRSDVNNRDEADGWGTSYKNYYHESSDPSSSESDDDFAIKEALSIRKKHLENLKSIKIESAISLVDSKDKKEENVDKNTQEVYLSLLLDALSNMPKKPVAKIDNIEDKCLIEAEESFIEIISIAFFKLSPPAECFAKIVLKAICLASIMLSAKRKLNLKTFAVEWVQTSLVIKKILHLMNKFFPQDELHAATLVCDAFFKHGNVSYLEKVSLSDNESPSQTGEQDEDNDNNSVYKDNTELHNLSSDSKFSNEEENSFLLSDKDLDNVKDDFKEPEALAKLITKDFKAHLYRVKQLSKLPVLPKMIKDPTANRNLTREIEKNRGLTRKRKKFSGNARVHNREKYRRKLIKLSGVRMKADEQMGSGEYTGESRGISMHVTRGRKLNY
uniref:Uncharacterized protein LOC113788308 n=1 Tax=Dermatophagoides pteronyssinus TaxID=6956 RepID=A0A6P6XJ63_DERPT|nr:uncharacterized protein LOC113788308 [Dermatophagoides pteronyssinus]